MYLWEGDIVVVITIPAVENGFRGLVSDSRYFGKGGGFNCDYETAVDVQSLDNRYPGEIDLTTIVARCFNTFIPWQTEKNLIYLGSSG